MTAEEKAAQEIADKLKSQEAKVESLKNEVDSLKNQGKSIESTEKALELAQESLKVLEQFKADAEKDIAEMNAKIEKSNKNNEEKAKSFDQIAFEALKLHEADLKAMQGMKGHTGIKMELKAAGTITTANHTGGTIGLTDYMAGFTRVARRTPYLRELVNVMRTNKMYVAWAEQTARDGGAASTAEGSAKTQSDFDIVEATKKVEKITSYMKVSKEALDDISYLRSEINSELMSLIELKLDELLYSGNGTTPNIKGIVEYATTFSVAATALANGVDQANNFDVIRAAVWQIQNAHYTPNYVLVNPVDAALMDMTKLTDGQYVIPPFTTADGQRVAGVTVIENTGVTAGNFLVGDFTKSNLVVREDMSIQIGYENDDFTKNLVTILAELRAVHFIKANHTTAFVKGSFATAKTALETA